MPKSQNLSEDLENSSQKDFVKGVIRLHEVERPLSTRSGGAPVYLETRERDSKSSSADFVLNLQKLEQSTTLRSFLIFQAF